MPRNGQFYVGKGGFAYKKNTGSGVRRVLPIGLITGTPADVNNKYVPGAGVGGQSIAVRRAKLINATSCNNDQKCGRFATYLGIHPKNSGQAITFESGLGQLGLPYTQYYNSSSFNPIRQPNQVILDAFNNIVNY
jgi:hypothetical protein